MHEHTHASADKRYDEQEVDRHTTGQREMPTTRVCVRNDTKTAP